MWSVNRHPFFSPSLNLPSWGGRDHTNDGVFVDQLYVWGSFKAARYTARVSRFRYSALHCRLHKGVSKTLFGFVFSSQIVTYQNQI